MALAMTASAQDPLAGTLTLGFGDLAAIKQKAETGDARAQLALGRALASQLHASEALGWFRKAAGQGNVEAQYWAGHMLLFGAPGIPSERSVQPSATEGIRWTFMAATNLNANACWNMGKALRLGLGTSTNLIEAYAWLKLFSETPTGWAVGRVEMNELALKLDTASLGRAEEVFTEFKAGKWRAPITRAIPEGDARLKLNGITFGVRTPLAVINGKTVTEGESVRVAVKPGSLSIKCLKIGKDFVVVAIEGEDEPRKLQLK